MTKKCCMCKEEKPLAEFNKCTSRADGLQTRCNPCGKQYYQNNKEQISAKNKLYHLENRAARNENCREYHKRNKEKNNEASRKYYELKKDSKYYLAHNRKWYQENKECFRAKEAKRRAKLAAPLSELDWFVLLEAQRLAKLRGQLLGTKWHVDHIIPVSLGGTNEYTNIQVVPAAWNLKKGNRNSDRFFDAVPRQQGA